MKTIESLIIAMLPLSLGAMPQESDLNLHEQSSKIFDLTIALNAGSQPVLGAPVGEKPPIIVVPPEDPAVPQPRSPGKPDQKRDHPAKTLIWLPIIGGVEGALIGGLLAFAGAEIAYKAIALGLLGGIAGALAGIIFLMVKMFGNNE